MKWQLSRRAILASLFGAGASVTASAQQFISPQRPTPNTSEPEVITGEEIGFRVDRAERDGTRIGALVVKVNGKWVEARPGMGVHRAALEP